MSVRTHGALTESSRRTPIGKGREGKGIGIRDEVPIHRHLSERASAMDGRFAASSIGGGRR